MSQIKKAIKVTESKKVSGTSTLNEQQSRRDEMFIESPATRANSSVGAEGYFIGWSAVSTLRSYGARDWICCDDYKYPAPPELSAAN